MSEMVLHGLGDCTPERNCGCMVKAAPVDELRERIARALWERELTRCGVTGKHRETARTVIPTEFYEDADAVIAALGLVEIIDWRTYRSYVTPWERIEEDG